MIKREKTMLIPKTGEDNIHFVLLAHLFGIAQCLSYQH